MRTLFYVSYFSLGILSVVILKGNLYGKVPQVFLWARWSYCHPTNSVKALKETSVSISTSSINWLIPIYSTASNIFLPPTVIFVSLILY